MASARATRYQSFLIVDPKTNKACMIRNYACVVFVNVWVCECVEMRRVRVLIIVEYADKEYLMRYVSRNKKNTRIEIYTYRVT